MSCWANTTLTYYKLSNLTNFNSVHQDLSGNAQHADQWKGNFVHTTVQPGTPQNSDLIIIINIKIPMKKNSLANLEENKQQRLNTKGVL